MNFDSIAEKARDGIDILCKTAEKTAEISKLKFEMASLKNKISRAYEALGKLCYEAAEKGREPDGLLIKPIVDDIAAKRRRMGELARMIKEIKGE